MGSESKESAELRWELVTGYKGANLTVLQTFSNGSQAKGTKWMTTDALIEHAALTLSLVAVLGVDRKAIVEVLHERLGRLSSDALAAVLDAISDSAGRTTTDDEGNE